MSEEVEKKDYDVEESVFYKGKHYSAYIIIETDYKKYVPCEICGRETHRLCQKIQVVKLYQDGIRLELKSPLIESIAKKIQEERNSGRRCSIHDIEI